LPEKHKQDDVHKFCEKKSLAPFRDRTRPSVVSTRPKGHKNPFPRPWFICYLTGSPASTESGNLFACALHSSCPSSRICLPLSVTETPSVLLRCIHFLVAKYKPLTDKLCIRYDTRKSFSCLFQRTNKTHCSHSLYGSRPTSCCKSQ